MTRQDRGAASVWLLAAGLVLVLAAGFGTAIGTATVARHRAQAAADLGALAGAARAVYGDRVACAESRRIVTANGARLAACRLERLDVIVTAEVPGPAGIASATARAGPLRVTAVAHSGVPCRIAVTHPSNITKIKKEAASRSPTGDG